MTKALNFLDCSLIKNNENGLKYSIKKLQKMQLFNIYFLYTCGCIVKWQEYEISSGINKQMTDYYPTLKKGRKEKEKVDKEKKKKFH